MKCRLQITIALSLVCGFLAFVQAFAYQKRARVTTALATGTYKDVLNTLEVLELPDHTVRINFSGYWPNDRKRVETRNMGSFDETVPLVGHTAMVKIQYGDEPCMIKLDFRPAKVIVTQEGSMSGCGFGFNVEADGTYLKTSSKPPNLPPAEKKNSDL